jgi:hypothetical protein
MVPRRDKDGCLIFPDYKEFKPNRTPKEIFEAGAFGLTYWRPIHSAVTGKDYKNMHKKYSFLKNIPDSKMTVPYDQYNKLANKYGVKTGSTLQFWEEKGWIRPSAPYGFIQWYCDFYSNKRGVDDEYQIKRWLGVAGPTGRFKRNLINQIKKAESKFDDFSISPKIRQVLLHWGIEITKKDLKN